MSQLDFNLLYDCWRSLPRRAGAAAPSRKYLRPDSMIDFLPRVILNERISRYELIQMLTGSQVEKALNFRMEGKNLFDLYEPGHEREILADFCETLLDVPCGGRLVRSINRPDGFTYTLSTYHLPMEDNQGQLNLLLGIANVSVGQSEKLKDGEEEKFHFRLKSIEYIDIGRGIPGIKDDSTLKDY